MLKFCLLEKGPLLEECKNWLNSLGVEQVDFLGYRNELRNY